MPPKQSREAVQRKQEISAKLKEIKDKQRKWMDEKKSSDCVKTGDHNSEIDLQSHNKPTDYKHTDQWHQHSYPVLSKSLGSSSPYVASNYESDAHNTPEEEDFDLIADRIIHRVKNDLQVSRGSETDDPLPGDEEFTHRVQSKALAAHMCHKCQQLMVSPHHLPMMLIPCGHNLCEACCRSAPSCYMCDVEISGLTSNVMLQQIIQSKHQHGKEKIVNKLKTPSRYQEAGVEYEVQSLLLRREAMEEEKYSIEQNIVKIRQSISGELEQISSVEKAEADIITKISHLQSKLITLQQHKGEFREKITTHQSQIEAERKKIEMIAETVSYLSSKLNTLNHRPS